MRRHSPLLTDVVAASLLLTLGIGVILYPYASGREMPSDLIDPRFILSQLEFFYRTLLAALHGGPADFRDAPFYYPWPRVANFSDTQWGSGAVYALVRALGMNLLAAYQAWFVAGFALTFVSAFVSLRMLRLRTWGAATAAFLFAFCLPMSGRYYAAYLAYRLWVPPAILALDRFLTRGSLRAGAACALFVALQLAVSIYLGLFLCLLLASYTVGHWLFARHRCVLPLWTGLRSTGTTELITAGILFAAGLVVLGIVGIPYFEVQSMYGFARSWEEVEGFLPRPGSYLLAGPSKLWPNLSATFFPNNPESLGDHQMFAGLSAIIPLAWFLSSKRARTHQPLAAPMIASVAILFALTIDLGGATLYWLIYPLPGFSAIRVVSRIILVLMFPLATLLGLLIDDLAATRRYDLPRLLVAVAVAVFVVVECSMVNPESTPADAWRMRLDALKTRLPKELPAHAVLVVATEPVKSEADYWASALTHIDALLAAITLGISTVNGYPGNEPPGWKPMTTCRDIEDNLRAGRHFLAMHGFTEPDVTSNRLVLVGFGACDLTQFTRESSSGAGRH